MARFTQAGEGGGRSTRSSTASALADTEEAWLTLATVRALPYHTMPPMPCHAMPPPIGWSRLVHHATPRTGAIYTARAIMVVAPVTPYRCGSWYWGVFRVSMHFEGLRRRSMQNVQAS